MLCYGERSEICAMLQDVKGLIREFNEDRQLKRYHDSNGKRDKRYLVKDELCSAAIVSELWITMGSDVQKFTVSRHGHELGEDWKGLVHMAQVF